MNEKSKKSGYAALKQLAKAPLKPAIRVDADSPKPRVRGPRDVSRKLRPRTTDASVGLRAKPAQREEYAIEPNPPGIQMGVQRLSIDETAEGQRIDNYLLRVLKGVPRSLVYRILRSGEVRINSGRAKPEQRVHSGDIVRVPPIRIGESVAKAPEQEKIDWLRTQILADERDMLVLNNMSRYQLVLAALKRVGERPGVDALTAWCSEQLTQHTDYIRTNGQDMPQVLNWR